ncbi:MAG TPA: carboxypeptidase-like regulatory domain-containing protein [Chitinophagaceae bacterium]|nr:carboxypeptidase-like regulatory domain-containing protein [Chitinophagaceae bacterium]
MRKKILFSEVFILIAFTAFSQVEGDVTDDKNKGITNVVITATDSTGKTLDTVKTDERGFYFFLKLKPGKYKIEAKAPGFVNATHTIRVNTAPADSNDNDDTYYAETLDIILKRPKGIK